MDLCFIQNHVGENHFLYAEYDEENNDVVLSTCSDSPNAQHTFSLKFHEWEYLKEYIDNLFTKQAEVNILSLPNKTNKFDKQLLIYDIAKRFAECQPLTLEESIKFVKSEFENYECGLKLSDSFDDFLRTYLRGEYEKNKD
ncbi:hypothetical protein K6973_05005 [Streptococcus dysgalactiae]|uniref:hypothetical protein n=1 Tax=Streptococcus dysgalactiae TaxID=1334 RepID=UPI001C9D853A|nr:hypothetical protein [Streptococcus dysgalactiae]QZT28086.1 hypothetical protein K6973_05005 [Streptococcus dysgalactiae]